MRKRKSTLFLAALLVLAGVLMLAYPAAAQLLSMQQMAQSADTYAQEVSEQPVSRTQEMLEEAQEYNSSLLKTADPFTLSDEQTEALHKLLSVNDDGIIGSIEIPKIGVYLPIYHGLGDDVLAAGIGHMDGSSLPIGGESTHCILAGHRGNPNATLFSNLDQLEAGDEIRIHVLNEILIYTVTSTEVIDPEDAHGMTIKQGEDLLTLITCTPYGINSQRLLVRASRSGTESADAQNTATVKAAASVDWWAMLGLVLSGIIALAAIVFCILFLNKSRNAKRTEDQNSKDSSS